MVTVILSSDKLHGSYQLQKPSEVCLCSGSLLPRKTLPPTGLKVGCGPKLASLDPIYILTVSFSALSFGNLSFCEDIRRQTKAFS